MFRCLPDFENCFNYTFDNKSTDGIFIFHGFPSQKNRNKDLAHYLSQNTRASIFVHHYEGLGESLGQFYFENTFEKAARYVDKIKLEFKLKRLHFLGHSWGGFVSLNLLPQFIDDLGSLVLYSPFTEIPEGGNISTFADALMGEYPHLFFHRTHPDVCAEFERIKLKYNFSRFLSQQPWQGPTLILQAKNDLATPEEKTRLLLPLLGQQLRYTELPIDHSFTQERSHTMDLTHQFYKSIPWSQKK